MNLELIPLPTVFICLLENNSILEISIHHFFGNWNIFLDDSTSWIHLAIVQWNMIILNLLYRHTCHNKYIKNVCTISLHTKIPVE